MSARPRWVLRSAACGTGLVFLLLIARFWHPVFGFTAFLQLDASNDEVKIAAFREQPVYVYRNTGGYDGLYYAQIAYHPTLTAPELAPAIDTLAYRARRILPPAVAWIVAGGNPAWIVHVYSVLNVAAWLALAFLLWRLLAVSDARGLVAWIGVLFSAGALASVRFALTDLVALTFIAGAFGALERSRSRWSAAALAAAALSRETSLLALAGAWEQPWLSQRNFFRGLAVVAPLAAWLLYVRTHVPAADPGLGNFAWPLVGLLSKWRASLGDLAAGNPRNSWPTLLVTLGLSAQAAFFVIRRHPHDRWWRTGVAYVALMLCLGWIVWEGTPGAAARVLLPLTLAFNVFAYRNRAGWSWLIIGNLTVVSGVLTLLDVHQDPRELAAARSHGVACVATAGNGWYNRESAARHTWFWCQGDGKISFEAWPKTDGTIQFEFEATSPAPRTIVVTQDNREVWRGVIEPKRARHSVPVHLQQGRAALEFSTPTPAMREGADAGARALAFALYDARLVVPEP